MIALRADRRWVELSREFRAYASVTLESATLTATREGETVDLMRAGLALTLAVTAASGTNPTLDVALQTSHDGATWTTVASFARATGATSERKRFAGLDRYVRVVSTLGGTAPSFTFSVTGEAY